MLTLRDELLAEGARLTQVGYDIEQQHNQDLLARVGLWIRSHTDSDNLVPYLRWRNREGRKMGPKCWVAAMENDLVSDAMRQDLYELEMLRCVHNAQVGTINTQLRRLRKILAEMDYADEVLAQARRVHQ